ncbi:EamA family transporter [Lentzea flaviverrucosa]|uniref:Threonine/homoserine efflux transporter RhtA n=1 Tax=Lentzea flaviverrucosa TaxID=200379 RepID=A0A1H9A787_9PSEU|nr:EamA family transporter [Lentzea flaviverrucosa]RDI32145.1 threonine/homoserine efflux transporter RhtA [Lentzea flaviverrucosa]SEP72550.1 Threonine/homoserine efflux transporter RhtA [Lentzea flaviverrucosa]
MGTPSKSTGLIAAAVSFISFGTSGAFVKPLLEAGWSPAAAVTARALTAGLVLLPFVIVLMRGRWTLLWQARWPVLGMGLVGVAVTQVLYFAAIQRIPVATALLIEFLAPLILVGFTWAVSRRTPAPVVLIGSVLAVGGLVLVIGPGAIQAVDPIGLAAAFGAAIGCSVYFVIAARPNNGLPPVALAGAGLLLAVPVLALVGATGLLPFTATFGDVPLFGTPTAWWVPLLVVAVIGTALAYASGITASGILGSRLASFIALLEVVSASLFAWLLLGEGLSPLQLLGGLLILGGIASVRAERQKVEPVPVHA